MATMKNDEFAKSMGRLETLAKGQLYHTSGDSNPGGWAGSSPETEDAMSPDSIDDNGTDYNGVKKSLAAKVAKSQALTPAEVAIVKGQNPLALIGQKLAKGQTLTPAENWAVKGGFDKFMAKGEGAKEQKPGNSASNEMHAAHDDGEVEAEANADTAKSFDKAVDKSSVLQKGLEMSPLLVAFAQAIGVGLQGAEARTVQKISKSLVQALGPVLARIDAVEKSIAATRGEQGEFNKSFAEAIVGIGHQVAGTAELTAQVASSPVGAPKSQLRSVQGGAGVNVVQKSFGGLDAGNESLQKSQVVNVMADMVMKGKLSATDVVKYESTGQISPAAEGAVRAFIAGNGQ